METKGLSWFHGSKSAVQLISGTNNNVLIPIDSLLISYSSALGEYVEKVSQNQEKQSAVYDKRNNNKELRKCGAIK